MISQSAGRVTNTRAEKQTLSPQKRLEIYGDRTRAGSAFQTALSDLAGSYAGVPILIYVVLSEGGGKGVDDHSRVAGVGVRDSAPFEYAFWRAIDTLDLVFGLAFADDEERAVMSHSLRELHRHIEGTLTNGQSYHAWNRDLWAWTWAGILKPIIDTYDILRGPVSDDFRQDAYIGALELGDMIGVRGLPDTYAEFLDYWEHTWLPLASSTGTAQYIKNLAYELPPPAATPWMPRPIWSAITWPIRNVMRTSLFIAIDPTIQQLIGIEMTRQDRISVAIHRLFWNTVPHVLTRNLMKVFIRSRLRFGNTSWNGHYSPENLAQHREQVKDARETGRPQPPHPSRHH
ncbi:oxygenase MpaB family protein [Mycobacteroides abscessus]